MTLRRLVAAVVLAVVGGGVLLGLEAAVRVLDDYSLAAARLPAFQPGAWLPPVSLASLAVSVGTAPDTDPAWIDQVPTPPSGPPDPDLVALRDLPRWPQVMEFDLYSVWNRAWLDAHGCQPNARTPYLPMPLLAFDPPGGSPHPVYRFPPGPHATRRAHDEPLRVARTRRPARQAPRDDPHRVRRRIDDGWSAHRSVGLSRSHGALAERLGRAPPSGRSVRSRERRASGHRLDGHRRDRPRRGDADGAGRDPLLRGREPVPPEAPHHGRQRRAPERARVPPGDVGRLAAPLRPWSALVRRFDRLAVIVATRNGREAPKPPYVLDWPPGLEWADPDIGRPDLPLQLPTILADLDAIHRDADADGTQLVLSSFVWLVSDGLQLDPIRQSAIYQWLNDHCWPYTYADLRRLVDFENAVYRRWAAARHVPFIDVAAAFPTDPELFVDPIHLQETGTRLHAWLAFQGLLPLVRDQLASRAWPRPDRHPLARHPNIGPPYDYWLPCAKGPFDPGAVARQ